MIRKINFITAFLLAAFVTKNVEASGSGLEVKDIFYCGADFSMLMSNGERWVVRKADVGEHKQNHFLSIAMFMAASGKKTGNVFPGTPISWCGNTGVRPIAYFGFRV